MDKLKLVSIYGYGCTPYPCGCCGMSYNGDLKSSSTACSAGLGIRVLAGKRNVKFRGKNQEFHYVETKQGPLTVLIRTGE